MPDFEFQPWERISPAVTAGEAHVRAWQWVFRSCGNCWFARRRSQTGNEWNYLYPPLDTISSVYSFYLDGAQAPQDWLPYFKQRLFVDEMTSNLLRVWQGVGASSGGSFFVAWHPEHGWFVSAIPLHRRKLEDELCPFALDWPNPVAETPSSLLFSRLQAEWEDIHSDLRFSVHAATLSAEERAMLAVKTSIGSSQDFLRLLRSALSAFGAKWSRGEVFIALNFRTVGADGKFGLLESSSLGIRERAILNHIVRAFEPRQMVDSPSLPSAVRASLEVNSFSISTRRPTMHEQLEAMLDLREWLTVHWPEGVHHLGKVV